MKSIGYIGLDIHKKVIAFCIKTNDGAIIEEGKIDATRRALTSWVSRIDRPWIGAMEATLFTGWIYDFLKPPRWNPELAALYARELARGNRNRATLSVARKLAVWLLAVDRKREPFQVKQKDSSKEKQQAA